MRKRILGLLLAVAALLIIGCGKEDSPTTTGASWTKVGNAVGPYIGTGFAPRAVLTLNDDTPYVMYQDNDYASKATVKMFNGTDWVVVGAAGFSEDSQNGANDLNLAFASDGTPYVAYSYSVSGTVHFSVMKFDGSAWSKVGDAEINAGEEPNYLSLAIDSDNNPAVAYAAYSTGLTAWIVRVEKFDGSVWGNFGGLPFSTGISNTIRYVRLKYSGSTPCLAFMDFSNAATATSWVFYWNATATIPIWEAVSTGITTDKLNYIDLAIDSTGVPYFGFSETGTLDLQVTKYGTPIGGSSTWSSVGDDSLDVTDINYLILDIDSQNHPWVAYTDANSRLLVKQFNGTAWSGVGSFISDGVANSPGFQVDSADVPYVVFSGDQNNGNEGIHVYKYK